MASLIYPQAQHDSLLWRAVTVSLGLHLLVVLMYPTLSKIKLPALPERIEIELLATRASAPAMPPPMPPMALPTPVEPSKVKPKPIPKPQKPAETPKPVLATPNNTEADYRVHEQSPAKVETARAEASKNEPAPSTVTETTPTVAATNNQTTVKEAKPAVAAATTSSTSTESEELTASDSDAWGDYGEQLRALVNKSKQYPAIAVRRHLEGEATVMAQFVKGDLVSVSLANSSKHTPLDEEAIRMVIKAIAQLGVKESLKKKSFKITIPVAFKLE